MNDHASHFFRRFICAVILLNLISSGAVFGADPHAAIEPSSTIVASARPARSGTADNGSLISLPGDGGKSAKQTKSANSAASTVQPSKYPRPNEMLQGVVYDLKRTKDLKPTDLIGGSATNFNNVVDRGLWTSVTKPFVNGSESTWRNTMDNRGNIRYPYFDNYYYCLPTRLFNSYFYLQHSDYTEGPKMLHAEGDLQGGGWIAIYSGYVVAPFTGRFRFVGFADDSILVRFNKNIVLDYGWHSLTMGVRLGDEDIEPLLGKKEPTAEQKNLILESPLFSKFKMDVWPVNSDNGGKHGLQRGVPINVQKGQVIPIDIVIAEMGCWGFSTMLFVERLDDRGKPYKTYPDKLPLFRTTAHLPSHPTLDWFPDFEDDGPIWKVVDFSGRPIPASRYAGQKIKIGFQPDDPEPTTPKAQTSATASTKTDAVKYVDELPGVFYDLKQTSDGESTYLMEMQEGKQFNRMRTMVSVWNLPDTSGKESVMVPYLKRFVISNWPSKSDSTGYISFNEFKQFSRSPINSYKSYFYQPLISSASAPKTYSGDGRVSDAGWIGINSGYVVAPFTGKFRFVGCGDDALVVRFNNQIVLDYGVYALSLGKKLDASWDYKAILGGTAAKTDPQNRMVLNNPVYSRCKLETYFPSVFANRGLAKGVPISVTKGKHYPIQILVSDIEQNQFGTALLIERLDSSDVPLNSDPSKLPLFRTSSALPGHSSGSGFPDFDENSPIWHVVDSKGKRIPSRNQEMIADTSNQDEKVSAQPKQEKKTAETKKEETPNKEQNLTVTTAKDVVSASDKVVSLTEALKAASELGGKQTISFNVKGRDIVETSSGDLFNQNIVFDTTNAATGNEVTVLIKKSKVEGRTTNANGGMICGKLNVDISELTGQNNTTHGDGGLLHLSDSVVNIRKSVFSGNNTPGPEHGGGTGYFENCTVTIEDCSFSNGQAYHGGGALYFHKKSVGSVKNCTFSSNRVTGYAGAVKIRDSEVTITDSVFENNSTGYSTGFRWGGGAIQIEGGHLIYTVSPGKTIVNTGNHGTFGGFVTICYGTAVFDIGAKGSLTLGTGKQADDYDSISTNFGDEPTGTSTVTKKGKGTMTLNAATSPFNGNWIVEDGVLNMNYGGNFAGAITVNNGRIAFSKDYTFTKLVIGLDAKKKDAYIGGASHLSGGKYCIVIDNAIPKGSYLLAEDAKDFNAPVTVQTKDGETLGSLVAGRITKICEGNCMLKLDGGTLSLSVFATINPSKKTNTETEKQNETKADTGTTAQEKQASNPQPQRDPNLRKTVTKSTRGNVTTETVTEYNGDTTIETVTTTEVNGDTTVQTTTITEMKNGVVVKKNTTTTTTEKQSATPANEKSNAEKATKEIAPTDIINLPGGVKLEMVKVEAGSFMMSADDGENFDDEVEHQATLKQDFYIGRMELTQAQWKSVMGTFNPSRFNMDDLPVDSVTWFEAMEFCEKLNSMGKTPKGWIFSLPTETQWEYAARGGKNSRGYKYSGSNSIDDVAWYTNNSGSKTHPVGKKDPNELGVYDMNGNVAEWCLDDWPDRSDQLKAEFTRGNDQYIAYRSNRGGGWSSDARHSRCASRYRNNPDFRHQSYGFRVALVQTEGLANASNQNKAENTDNKSSSGSNSTPKKNNPTYNPFGYTSPLMED